MPRIWTGRSTRTQPSIAGPTTIPATISRTTPGSRRRGTRPSANGAANAIAATASKLTKETAGISRGAPGSAARSRRFALADRDLLQPEVAPSLTEVRIGPQGTVDRVKAEGRA